MAASASWVVFLLGVCCFCSFAEGDWCVAKSKMKEKQLQSALDYACGNGADCRPIQASGPCFLPNTLQAHASYAFNSYYQKNNRAPGSCDFGGTATVTSTDPSYGSCAFPSSSSTAGGTIPGPSLTPTINTPNAPPATVAPPFFGGDVQTPSGSTNRDDNSAESLPLSSLVPLFWVSVIFILRVE